MAKQRPESSTDGEEREDVQKRRRGSSRMFWLGSRLLILLVLVGGILYFAPALIVRTGVWRSILSSSAPELAAQLDIQSLDLSWFAPIEVHGITLREVGGEPLAEIPLIRSRNSLLSIALNQRHLGVFEVSEPRAKIVLRRDGSNIEDLLAKLPKQERKGEAVSFGLVVLKAAIQFEDAVSGRKWLINDAGVDLNWPSSATQAKTGKFVAMIGEATASNTSTGNVGAEFSWTAGASDHPLGTGTAKISLQGLPTQLVEGGLRRFAADIRPQGPLTLQASCSWDQTKKSQQLVIEQLSTPGLAVSAPKLLQTDRPKIAIQTGQANVQVNDGRATVSNVRLDSNLLQVAGKGSAAVGSPGGDVELTGQINLAEIARQLPATIHLRADTQVNSGMVQVAFSSQPTNDGRRFQGSLKTREVRAIAAGHPVSFNQPIEITYSVRQTAKGPVIEQLIGQAGFLRLEGEGTVAAGSIKAEANLDELVVELGRLIDWGDTRLAGNLVAGARWSHDGNSGWNANADARVQNFEIVAASLAPWREPDLHVTAAFQGQLIDSSLEQITAAKFGVESGGDRLDAELTESVKKPSTTAVWPVKFALRGDLASWMPRLQPFVPLGGWRMAGAIDAGGSGRFSTKQAELSTTNVQIAQLAVEGPGVSIREPIVKLETGAAWSREKATVALAPSTFASSALAFRADDVRLTLGKEQSVVGTLDLRGDLAKLSGWFGGSQQPRNSQVTGALTGHLEIGYRGDALAAKWNADVENMAYLVAPPPQSNARTSFASTASAPAWHELWQEPHVNFTGQGSFAPAAKTLKIEQAGLVTSVANITAAGAVKQLGTSPDVDLSGEISYDLALVTQQIQSLAKRQGASTSDKAPYGLDTLQLTGKEKRQFVLKGPVFAATGAANGNSSLNLSEALSAEASLGWQGAQYVGLVAGPADFRAKLAGGTLQIGPLDVPLADGRLTSAPRLPLNSPTPTIAIDRGPLLQNVRISPEMCSLWLKYVAPLVAEATRAEGKFSLTLAGANVPISSPLASDAAGTLSIQSAQIGPGPLAQQYLGMAKHVRGLFSGQSATTEEESRGWVILPQQDVPFEVHDGAVINRGLKMTVGDVVVTTEGSVNIQTQQIHLVASLPLNENWFKQQDGIFATLKGQTVQIPIDGTLSQPRLDTRALEGLGKQLAGSALQGLIKKPLEGGQNLLNRELERGGGTLQRELGQGLNRLFGPLAPQPAPPAAPPAAGPTGTPR